ncbi:MAG: bifunctional 5,10-methylenetetrahydrofolate dehydrogenase/5,10-methenyltetrahydrofolate cyclohydrolase [Microgenomates group bacterium]
MMVVFDGKKLAAKKEKVLAKKVAEFKKRTGITPKLVAIMVGEDSASKIYLRQKAAAAKRVGIEFEKIELIKLTKPAELIELIKEKNEDKKVQGIMIQLPLPKNCPIADYELRILETIIPTKDIDCLTPQNLGLLAMGAPRFLPATVKAILEIIKLSNYQIANLKGIKVCVVGASNIVGKPLALHLSNLGATVTICRRKTKNLAEFTSQADLLISATGVPKLIKKEMVKKGAVVIDVGSPVGDVDPLAAVRASFITPVPGGVGPLTVVSLLENLFEAALAFEGFPC